MDIIAKNSHVTVTPRKLQRLAAAIRHLPPQTAITQLTYLNHSAATPLLKTLKQAIANAVNNFKLSPEHLRIKTIVLGKGITYKRGHAGARGRFKPYEKTRSHITIMLSATTPSSPSTLAEPTSTPATTSASKAKSKPKQ